MTLVNLMNTMNITRRTFVRSTCAAGFGAWLAPSSVWGGQASGGDAALKPGRYALNLEKERDGLFYLPAGYKPDTPMPMMVVLHGAGGSSETATGAFPLADELGFIVMATDSKEWTWDSIIGAFGPDVEFLQRAFVSVVQRCSVDRSRLALTGFSDGASYALSLGIGNGDVFKSIIAGSPGVMQPAAALGKPRIFISHGTADNVMPINDTSRKFVPRLRALGYDITYREYEGRHTWPPEIRREAYVWWVDGIKKV